MKYLIVTLSLLPLLVSCEMDSDFYDPAPPRVQLERNNHHEHQSRSRSTYDREPVQRYAENRSRFDRPAARRAIEVSPNVHQHPAAPAVRRARPGVRIETPRNSHGHPENPGAAVVIRKKPSQHEDVQIEVQKNVHGHD